MKTHTILLGTFAAAGLALITACSGTVSSSSSPAVTLEVTDFTLTDTAGESHTLSEYIGDGKTVVLEWFNPDCPFVKRYHDTNPDQMAAVYEQVGADADVVWLAINSGSEGKQGAGMDRNSQAVADWQLPYPVLLDMDGTVGQAYGAKTTPHMFIITDGKLVYEGAIDDSSGRGEADTNFVVQAFAEFGDDKAVSVTKTKPFGCSVKY
jgi:peroxiredoxin